MAEGDLELLADMTPRSLPRSSRTTRWIPITTREGTRLGCSPRRWVSDRTIGNTFAEQIMDGLDSSPVIGVRTEGPWGWLYEVRMQIDGLNGQTHPVTTVWFSEAGTGPPRLTTAYVAVP